MMKNKITLLNKMSDKVEPEKPPPDYDQSVGQEKPIQSQPLSQPVIDQIVTDQAVPLQNDNVGTEFVKF